MREIILKNFNPQKAAPNFYKFLSERGEVTFGEEVTPESRYGMAKGVDLHEGIRKEVFLGGVAIGFIEVYINPPALVFEGIIPNCPVPKQRGRSSASPDLGDGSRIVSISYHGEHPLAEKTGRNDGWKTIPFP